MLAEDNARSHGQIRAPRLIIHALQFVLAQQPRSLERRKEIDPIGPSFTKFTCFGGHHPAQPTIEDDVPRVRRDDAHVVPWFELTSVLNQLFIQFDRAREFPNACLLRHGSTKSVPEPDPSDR